MYETQPCIRLRNFDSYPAGAKLISRTKKPNSVLFIIKGKVNIARKLQETIFTLTAGQYFGDLFFCEKSSSLNYRLFIFFLARFHHNF